MKKIILSLVILILMSVAIAEVDGSKGFQVLRIASNPAIAAQAETGVLFNKSGFSFMDNAAASMLQKGKTVSVSQNLWLFDTNMTSISYVSSKGSSSFGFGMRYLDYGKIDNYDDTGNLYGEYHPMDMLVTMNLGYRLLAAHYLGVNLSFLYEQIDDSSATGIAADLGYVYSTPVQGMNLLASVKNIGVSSRMDKEEVELPVNIELEISERFPWQAEMLSASLKLIKEIDNDNLKSNLGIQAQVHENFALRSGYKLGSDLQGITLGFGINFKRIVFDYAYLSVDEDLEDVHQLGLSWQF